MKKVLSLVLAFAMILGSFGFVFASDFSDVEDTEYYSEPVNVLSGLGVIAGYPDGTFQPTKVVTRAEMATMIVAALGIPVKGGATTKRFEDVPLDHWAAGYIDYAASVGFVAGYPDGTFKPSQAVSYNEALTMIVASLGYSAESLPGVWPGNFVNKAQSLGLLEICKTTGTAGAPRQDIACFLYKALNQPIGYTDKDGVFQKNIGSDGGNDTMMKRLGAQEYKPESGAKGDAFVVTGEEQSDLNMKNYLGAYITAYADKNNKIIAIKEVLSKFVEGEYDKDAKKVGDTKIADTARLLGSDGDDIGKYVGFSNGDEATSEVKDYTVAGNLKVAIPVDATKITVVYSVQLWDAAGTFQAADSVQDELTDDKTLATGSYKFALDDDKEIVANAFAIEGVDSIKDIKEDDIVTVYLHKKASDNYKVGDIAKVEVSDKTIEGAVTKISKTLGDTPTADECKAVKYTIAGTAYALNEFMSDDDATGMPKLLGGDPATFFLDYAGKVFTYKADAETTDEYGVVLTAGVDKGRYAGDNTAYVKLVVADGTTKEFAVDSDAEIASIYKGGWLGDWVVTETDNKIAGTLVKYTLDEDVITDIVPATKTIAAGESFSPKGVYGGASLTDDTVVFSFKGTTDADKANGAKYEVIEVEKLYSAKLEKAASVIESTSKTYDAVLVAGVATEDEAYAIFVGSAEAVADGELWTALYEGKADELTVKKGKVGSAAYTSGASVTLCTLSFNSSDVVESVGTLTVTAMDAKLDAGAVSYSGGKIVAGDKTKYTVSDDAKLYVYNGEEWSAKDITGLNYRKNAETKIYLINKDEDPNKDITIVLVVMK